MAKVKEIKPFHDVKSDFIASMDRAMHEAGMLLQAVETLLRYIEHNSASHRLSTGTRYELEKRTKALRTALYEPLELR